MLGRIKTYVLLWSTYFYSCEAPINSYTYKEAGVDIDAGAALVDEIKPLAASTHRPGVVSGLGGFAGIFDLKAAGFNDPLLLAANDGVGTKLKIAIEAGIHDTVGIDLVAMCVNDLVVQGAEPLLFLDYFATGKLDVAAGRDIFGNSYCCSLNCPVRRMIRRHEAVHPFEICVRSAAGKYIPVVASVIVTPEEKPSRPDVIHLLYPQKERVLESEPPLDLEPTEDAFSYYVRLGRLRRFVEIHYADPISLALAAEVATMEPRYFSKFFHDKTGVCFKDWLASVRVGRAKEMMASSNYTITQTAFSVGFGDLRTFERNFKKHAGMTPREFKETVRPH